VLSSEGVEEQDVDFGPVEGSVALVDLPLLAKEFKRLGELVLSLVPEQVRAHRLVRPGRQVQLVFEAEDPVDLLDEPETPQYLPLDLVLPTENVRVILLKPPDTGEAAQSARQFIPMEHSEVRHFDR